MAKLAIRTRLMCGELHCSDSRETDSVPVVLVVSLMPDLAHTFFFPTMIRAVVPVAKQTVLHVSDSPQIGMLFWITCPHTLTDMARQHIRLFGCFMQSNSDDVCRVKCDSGRARWFVGSQVVGFDYHFVLACPGACVVSQSQKHDFLLDKKLACVTQEEMPFRLLLEV